MSQNSSISIFHLAFPVMDVESTVDFYRDQLGFQISLIEENRCIINFSGHQLVAHKSPEDIAQEVSMYPRHFGIILDELEDFEALLDKAKAANIEFFQEDFMRFPETERAHRSFFLKDPSNNLLEFKWYKNPKLIFTSS